MKRPSENPFIRVFRRPQTVVQPFLPIGEHHEHQKIRTLRHHHPFYCHPAPFRTSRHRLLQTKSMLPPDTFSFQTADGNIVCRARTINSGDLFDIDLLGRAPSVVCLIHRTESGKGHDCQPDGHAYASLQNSIPNRGCLSGIPAEFYRPNPKYRILQEKEKVETPLFHLPAERRRNRLQQHRKSDRLPLKPG